MGSSGAIDSATRLIAVVEDVACYWRPPNERAHRLLGAAPLDVVEVKHGLELVLVCACCGVVTAYGPHDPNCPRGGIFMKLAIARIARTNAPRDRTIATLCELEACWKFVLVLELVCELARRKELDM